jgi:hypothetical protein
VRKSCNGYFQLILCTAFGKEQKPLYFYVPLCNLKPVVFRLFLPISFSFLSLCIIHSVLLFALITCDYIEKRNKLCLFSRLILFIITKWILAHRSTPVVVNVVQFATPHLHILPILLPSVSVVCVRKHSAPRLAFLSLLT